MRIQSEYIGVLIAFPFVLIINNFDILWSLGVAVSVILSINVANFIVDHWSKP